MGIGGTNFITNPEKAYFERILKNDGLGRNQEVELDPDNW